MKKLAIEGKLKIDDSVILQHVLCETISKYFLLGVKGGRERECGRSSSWGCLVRNAPCAKAGYLKAFGLWSRSGPSPSSFLSRQERNDVPECFIASQFPTDHKSH